MGRLFFDRDAHRGRIVAQSVKVIGNTEFTAYLGGIFGPSAPATLMGASVRISY